MFRILHVISTMNIGGAETLIFNLYQKLDRTRIQFDFLLNSCGTFYESKLRDMGANIYYIPPRNKLRLKYMAELNKFFKAHQNEFFAIHQHASSLSSIEPLIAARKNGINKRIIHIHNTNASNMAHVIMHRLNKFTIGNIATDFLSCSDKATQWAFSSLSTQRQVLKINNGIDTDIFRFSPTIRNTVRKQLKLEDNQLTLLHVGRFMPVKNHCFLIHIMAELVKKIPNAKLLLVGDGETRGEIEQLTNKLNLSDNVVFLGLRLDVNELLMAADFFIMPSLHEGLPVSLVEAQSSGIRVLCSDNISKDVILSDTIEFLSIQQNPLIWANKILDSIKLINQRKDCSAQITSKGFSIQASLDLLIKDVYKIKPVDNYE